MQQTKQLRRYGRIINKLSGIRRYVPAEELLDAAQGDNREEPVTRRTLQRNFHEIEDLFGITVKHAAGKGYYISEYASVSGRYVQLLRDIEMLQLVEENKELHDLIIPEESQMVFSVEIAPVIQADAVRSYPLITPISGKTSGCDGRPSALTSSRSHRGAGTCLGWTKMTS